MPKSKRDRKIALTKVTKKVGLNVKQELIDKIRQAVDNYERLFVFTIDNMRNQKLKALRDRFKDTSKFFLGKNRVMSVALGKINTNFKPLCLRKKVSHQTG
jgi:mRNA turnover protein 4